MLEIKLNLENTGIEPQEILEYKQVVENIHKDLHGRAHNENDFVGWIDLPTNYDKEEFARIQAAAKKIQSNSQVLIVIGKGISDLPPDGHKLFADLLLILIQIL